MTQHEDSSASTRSAKLREWLKGLLLMLLALGLFVVLGALVDVFGGLLG